MSDEATSPVFPSLLFFFDLMVFVDPFSPPVDCLPILEVDF